MELSDIKFTIERKGGTPVWQQVKQILTDCIAQGIWKPGQIIANEHTLFDIFQVSIGTIRKAVSELEAEGILIRKQGVGTFVSNHDKSSFLYKYFHITPNKGEKVFPVTELLAFDSRKIRADEAILKGKSKATKVFQIRNQLRVQNKVCIIDDITIACDKFPLLTEEIFAARTSTIYSLYQDRFGIFVVRTSESLKAVAAPKDIATLLNVAVGEPILKISRVSYTFNDSPIELRTSYVHTKDVHYHVQQSN